MAGIELATGFVNIVPSASGIADKLRSELSGPIASEGEAAGEGAGEGFFSGFKGKAVLLAAGVGAAAGALIAKGLGQAIDAEAGASKLGAQLGLNDADTARAGKVAGELYAQNFGGSMDDVRGGLESVVRNIDGMRAASEPALESITGKALNLSSTFEQDIGGTTAAVAQLIRNGLAPDAESALDILTVGFQSGANKADDLLDTITEYGTQFRKLGIDGKTATGLLNQGLQAGARDADTVADAIKEFSIRGVDGSKLTAESFDLLGLNATDMMDRLAAGGDTANDAFKQTLVKLKAIEQPALRSQIAVGLFGTKAEDLGDALFALDPSTAAEGLGEVTGAATRLGDQLANNTASDLETFKRRGEVALTNMASAALPAINKLLDVGVPALDAVKTNLANLAAPAVRKSVDFLKEEVPLGFSLLKAGFQSGDVTSDGFHGALERIGVEARKVFDWLKENVPPAIEAIGNVIRPLMGWLEQNVLPLLSQMGETFASAFGALVEIVRTVVKIVVDLWSRFGEQLLGRLKGALENVLDVVRGTFGILQGIFDLIKSVLTGDWAGVWEAIKQIFSSAWDVITGLLRTGWDLILGLFEVGKGLLSGIWSFLWHAIHTFIVDTFGATLAWIGGALGSLLGWFGELPGKLLGFLGDALSWLFGWGVDLIQGLINGYLSVWANVLTFFADFATAIPGAIGDALVWLFEKGKDLIRGLINGYMAIWAEVLTFLGGFITAIPGAVGDAALWLLEAGKDTIRGLLNGFKAIWHEVEDWLAEKINFLPGFVKDFLGIGSPSKVFAELGRFTMQGFAVGLRSGFPSIEKELGRFGDLAAAPLNLTAGAQTASPVVTPRRPTIDIAAPVSPTSRGGLTVTGDLNITQPASPAAMVEELNARAGWYLTGRGSR